MTATVFEFHQSDLSTFDYKSELEVNTRAYLFYHSAIEVERGTDLSLL